MGLNHGNYTTSLNGCQARQIFALIRVLIPQSPLPYLPTASIILGRITGTARSTDIPHGVLTIPEPNAMQGANTMSRPFKLYRLQQIDSQLDRMIKRLREIEIDLNEDRALRQASDRSDQANEGLEKARKAQRRAEDNVLQQRVKIEQSEATLYSGKVRNPKELQDLENESASLKRYLSVLEDRQLEAMLAEEEAASSQVKAARELEKVRSQFAQQSNELLQEKERLLKDCTRSKEERQAAISSIPEEDMRLYTGLRQKSRGIAVAKVTDEACSACGSTLNSVLLHAARSPFEVNCCDTCGRILYAG